MVLAKTTKVCAYQNYYHLLLLEQPCRFYSNSMGEVTIKMANARMEYAYEYLGNANQLVRTPLTQQCFITLTQVGEFHFI